jgi:hypothetical protein
MEFQKAMPMPLPLPRCTQSPYQSDLQDAVIEAVTSPLLLYHLRRCCISLTEKALLQEEAAQPSHAQFHRSSDQILNKRQLILLLMVSLNERRCLRECARA